MDRTGYSLDTKNQSMRRRTIISVWLRLLACSWVILACPHLTSAQSVTIDVQQILDEGDGYIIAQPNDASVNENGFIAISELRQAKVLIFNAKGEFLRSIGRRGNGPGEFQMVYHIELVGDHLFTLDIQLQRVSVFDLNTGKVLKTGTYKELFNGWSPSNTTSFYADGSGWIGVVTTDLSADPGANTKMKLVALNADLKVSDKYTFEFDVDQMLRGREEFAMSFFRPVSNYNFIVDTAGIVWAPYYMDGVLFRIPRTNLPTVVKSSITLSQPGLTNKVFSDSRERDSYVKGRSLITGSGSSPTGAQHFAVFRHSLQLFRLSGSFIYLYSEYSEQSNAFEVHYKLLETSSVKEIRGGKVRFHVGTALKPGHNLRRILTTNSNGTSIVQYMDDGDFITAIAKITVDK